MRSFANNNVTAEHGWIGGVCFRTADYLTDLFDAHILMYCYTTYSFEWLYASDHYMVRIFKNGSFSASYTKYVADKSTIKIVILDATLVWNTTSVQVVYTAVTVEYNICTTDVRTYVLWNRFKNYWPGFDERIISWALTRSHETEILINMALRTSLRKLKRYE